MAKQIPQRAEGWKFKGANGRFTVWHAGKNDYRVTDGRDGRVIEMQSQFGLAFSAATRHYNIDRFYADRNESGQAALTAHS